MMIQKLEEYIVLLVLLRCQVKFILWGLIGLIKVS